MTPRQRSARPVAALPALLRRYAWLGLVLAALCQGGPALAQATGDAAQRNLVVQAASRPVAAEQRLALVIGNSAYKDAPLTNPVNDARAVAKALEGAGYTVLLRTDLDHRGMLDMVRQFGDRLRQGGVGIFYYAGHGMQIKGRNYLIPVGADIQREDEVAYTALDAQAVLDKMEAAANRANLVILDACRNNPFARSFRSATQGLAQMEAPVGTLVAFSTAPGGVASDGQGGNGLYTSHLLTAMATPGAKVEDVFKRVRAGVRRDSQGKQIPWETTSLEGDLYFHEPVAAAPAVASTPAAPAAVAAPRPTPTPTPTPTPVAPVQVAPVQVALAPAAASPAPTAARPAPQRNAQGFTVGDKWNYQIVDKWRSEVTGNYGIAVGRLLPDGGWATPKGGREHDESGRLRWYIAGDGSKRSYEPFFPSMWPGMKVGDSRRFELQEIIVETNGTRRVNHIELEGKVLGQEKVVVPAGSFDALRVEFTGMVTAVGSAGAGRVVQTYWYVPQLRTRVAQERENSWNGKPNIRDREELTSYSLAN